MCEKKYYWLVKRRTPTKTVLDTGNEKVIMSCTDLMGLHLTSLNQFTTQRTLNGGVDLLDVVLQLCPRDGLVTVSTEGDIPGAVESVHHAKQP